MPEAENKNRDDALVSNAGRQHKNVPVDAGSETSRRQFLLLAPLAALAAIAGTMLFAALRFLRPRAGELSDTFAGGETWHAVAPLSEVRGDQPVLRKVLLERQTGWASEIEQHSVYLLPRQNNRVVSAICPHENCLVAWREDEGQFACPCHGSRFTTAGEPLDGPATSPLTELPSRIENDTIEVRFPTDTISSNAISNAAVAEQSQG